MLQYRILKRPLLNPSAWSMMQQFEYKIQKQWKFFMWVFWMDAPNFGNFSSEHMAVENIRATIQSELEEERKRTVKWEHAKTIAVL